MTYQDIANLRFHNQQIGGSRFKKAKDVVNWMGALQAQDYPMSKWALGCRMADAEIGVVETALKKGEIIRTHVLRPTWHLVTPVDIGWMIALSSERIRASMKSRNKELELTDKILLKSNKVIEKTLLDSKFISREELTTHLLKAKIPTDNNRLSHLLLWAELECIICSGPDQKNKQTYALFSERAGEQKKISKEEALKKLSEKYFRSHGPATLNDFAWWSGLNNRNASNAIENTSGLLEVKIKDERYFYYPDSGYTGKINDAALLPAYDEFLISYRNRTASLQTVHHQHIVSINGIFRPVIILNAQVTGYWKRIIKDAITIEATFFKNPGLKEKKKVEDAASRYADFYKKKFSLVLR